MTGGRVTDGLEHGPMNGGPCRIICVRNAGSGSAVLHDMPGLALDPLALDPLAHGKSTEMRP